METCSLTVHFACQCGILYAAQQELRADRQSGRFNCTECNELVNDWDASYDYIDWRLVVANPNRKGSGRKTGTPWTADEEGQLFELLNQGKSLREASHEIHRTPQAIYARLQRIYRRRSSRSVADQ